MPAGTSTVIVETSTIRPSPRHLRHGFSMIEPVPLHLGQGPMLTNWPNSDERTWRTRPWPPQVAHVDLPPFWAPLPSQVSQVTWRLTWIVFLTPVATSSSDSLSRTRRSLPRRIAPSPPPPPPNRSSKPPPPPPP